MRDATAADLERLVDYNAAMARETEGLVLDRDRLRAGIGRILGEVGPPEERPRGHYRIALAAGRPVGALLVTREWSDWRDGWFWWIQSVYVEPQARRRGVLTGLFGDVLERARARPDVCGVRLYVDRENGRARAAYRRLGMSDSSYRIMEVDLVLERG